MISEVRTVTATRYVTPLREGGSLPAIVEADDSGLYVLKFRGAGQGPKALIAELLVGELARALELPVPEIVLVELDEALGKTEGDPEIQELIRASVGLNLALDYLPGSITFDPLVETVESGLASRVVWLDAFLTNVDRTPRNPNLLMWQRKLWLIDHGASLYFHHAWDNYLKRSQDRFPAIREHVLLPFAGDVEAADAELAGRLTPELIRQVVALIPESWLTGEKRFTSAEEHRAAYAGYLTSRLKEPRPFVEEAGHARTMRV